LELLFKLAVCGLLISVCVYDYKTYRIPNNISLILLALFPIAYILGGISPSGQIFSNWFQFVPNNIVNAILGILIVTLVTLPQYLLGWMGGGDFKVIMTSSLWIGFHNLQYAAFGMALSGGVLAISYIFIRRHKNWNEINFLKPVFAKTQGVPYGIAISIGAIPCIMGMFN
jgi:prepilin peptidase CpaA